MAEKVEKTTSRPRRPLEENKRVVNMSYYDVYEVEELDERHLYLNSMIDESVIDSIVYHILRYNRLDKGIPVNKRKPIIVYINSPGGDVTSGYGLIDAIEASNTPVYTVNQAMCASMAFLIFLAGAKRFSMAKSEFLMHDGRSAGWDSTAKLKDRMDFETGQLEELTRHYIISHTKIDEDLYKEKYRIEWYFLPDEAKKLGVVDYIVGKDCNIDEII